MAHYQQPTHDRSVAAAEWPAAAFYRGMFDRRSAEELRLIARIKRFAECFRADASWRAALRSNPDRAQDLLHTRGIDLDARVVAGCWSAQESGGSDSTGPLQLWTDWNADLAQLRQLQRAAADTSAHNRRFESWRRRQLRRLAHEIDPRTLNVIANSLFAYELSRGCSVGCWFCGASAEHFGGHVAYDKKTANLWQGMLESAAERFGPAAATGFCYWGSDPSDNPDYCRFIQDHRRITGWLPPTTTAVPLRSPELTSEILALVERHSHTNSRFSVLSLRSLERIHASFDVDRLLKVDLVLQMKGSLTPKAKVGRALTNAARVERDAPPDQFEPGFDQGTTACVTGFLVNLPRQTVQLIAPCRADERQPKGYYVFGERSFATAADFGAALDDLVASGASDFPDPTAVLAFHRTVRTHFADGTLVITSPGGIFRMRSVRFLPRLIDLIAERRYAYGELLTLLARDFPDDVLAIPVMLHELFENGLFEETPVERPVERSI